MQTTRTSENSPLRIAAVTPGDGRGEGRGRIGITLCPGKTDSEGISGPWARDLDTDLDAIRDWGATAVISLITRTVGRRPTWSTRRSTFWGFGTLTRRCATGTWSGGTRRYRTGCRREPASRRRWKGAGEAIRDRLRLGFDVLVHCKGGLGRAGTVAARLLVELGEYSRAPTTLRSAVVACGSLPSPRGRF